MIHIKEDHPAYKLAVERLKMQKSAKRVMAEMSERHAREHKAAAKTFRDEANALEAEINPLLDGKKCCCSNHELFEATGLVVIEEDGHHGPGGGLGGILGAILGGGGGLM